MPPSSPAFHLLPLRDTVFFPHVIAPFFIGRKGSVRAVQTAFEHDKTLIVAAQRESSVENPRAQDFFPVGTKARILQLIQLPDASFKVLLQGEERWHIQNITSQDTGFMAQGYPLHDTRTDADVEALRRALLEGFDHYLKLGQKNQRDVMATLLSFDDTAKLVDTLAFHIPLKVSQSQTLLETLALPRRLELLMKYIEEEIDILTTGQRIRTRVKKQVEKSQKEFFLNEQMKAIQRELDVEDLHDDLKELSKKIQKTPLSDEARERAEGEVKKLSHMNPMSSEAALLRTYLDWLLAVPWKHTPRALPPLSKAEDILNKGHYGLEKIKERILEMVAVHARVGYIPGHVLNLVGPPGVGKTSLVRSIAKAMNREFVRISLGGVRDEAEIRGHRRTYIGAMPGKIIQALKKTKRKDCVILLDELDKMGNDWRGDPASALLEVLDPEQNHAFNDHYLEVDYDLSKVIFIATSNTLNIPPALRDRLETLRLSGYTRQEKMHIARDYLIPRQKKQYHLKKPELTITDDALSLLLEHYCREAGVRNLEREIANISRKTLRRLDQPGAKKKIIVSEDNLKEFAGIPRYQHRHADREDQIGITTGLAWTEVGGELLMIEALKFSQGKGKVTATGKLGDVMKESVQAAASFVRSRLSQHNISPDMWSSHDIHVHVPEGATPKDGPSAGVAMCTSLMSVLTQRAVKASVAMTGEVSLRGRVMMIGGLKEKILAAHLGGITTVLIPQDNAKDLEDIPQSIQRALTIIPVETVDDVWRHALV